MEILLARLTDWWEALVHPDCAGRLVLETEARPGFSRFLVILIALLYALYGLSMGVFRGWAPGMVACAKLPFLFFLTLAVCFPAFYVLNCLYGPALRARQCLRLLLMAISANAAALASYALFSFFFTLTTSRHGYTFLVLMHVIVFGLSGVASLVVIALVFRATAATLGIRLRPLFVLAWGVLYAFVGTQMAWVLRPWIGSWTVPYQPFRPLGGSFLQAVWKLIT